MDDCKVTWLMPVKNGMPFIKDCLESIHSQTFKNQQIIVWDNGSNDGSIDELKKWIPNLIPGEIILNKPIDNLGECRAELIKRAQTELIAIMDCDDICHKKRLEMQVPLINKSLDIAGVGSYINRIDEKNNFISLEKLPHTNPNILKWQLLFRNSIYQPTMLLRKSLVLSAGNYNFLETAQDYDLWFRLINRGKIKIINKPLLNYRIVKNSVSDLNRMKWSKINKELYIKYSNLFFIDSNQDELLELWSKLSPQSEEYRINKIDTNIFIKYLFDFSKKNKIDIYNLIFCKLILKQYLRSQNGLKYSNLFYLLMYWLLYNENYLKKIK
tara:strand:- start:421 stop:1401 length:981 start_codon:yes stop_codon:yes gene_type:complete